jgi:hypothetical protein
MVDRNSCWRGIVMLGLLGPYRRARHLSLDKYETRRPPAIQWRGIHYRSMARFPACRRLDLLGSTAPSLHRRSRTCLRASLPIRPYEVEPFFSYRGIPPSPECALSRRARSGVSVADVKFKTPFGYFSAGATADGYAFDARLPQLHKASCE